MLEDPQLRRIFQAEGAERLAKMEAALLRLEAAPQDAGALDEVFREAHNLKGAARMAGLDALGERAHGLEDALSSARASGLADAAPLLRALDEMRALLADATGARPAVAPKDVKPWAPPSLSPSTLLPALPSPSPGRAAPGDDGIRVDARHLDGILGHVGELAVARRRLERRLDDLARLALDPAARRVLDEAREDHARLSSAIGALDEATQTMRLTPVRVALGPFQRAVRDVAAASGKRAHFVAEGSETRLDKRVLDEVKDALLHLVRNAVDHGLEAPEERLGKGKVAIGVVKIRAYPDGAHVVLEVEDDGRGFDVDAIQAAAARQGMTTSGDPLQLIFEPGFSTARKVTTISGRGVGLDVVRETVRRLKGSVDVANRPGHGATFRLRLPVTTAATRVLLVRCGGRPWAFPVEAVERVDRAGSAATSLARVLDLPGASPASGALVTLRSGESRATLVVDEIVDEVEVVVKPHTRLLRRVRHVAGATIIDSGEICLVLHPDDLVRSALRGRARLRVLVVDDSDLARAKVAQVLQGAGYDPTTAKNGVEAVALAATTTFDAVVTDLEMPEMNGLELLQRLRADPRYARVPLLLVTSRHTAEDRKRGKDAGADAHVAKGAGSVGVLLEELARLTARE